MKYDKSIDDDLFLLDKYVENCLLPYLIDYLVNDEGNPLCVCFFFFIDDHELSIYTGKYDSIRIQKGDDIILVVVVVHMSENCTLLYTHIHTHTQVNRVIHSGRHCKALKNQLKLKTWTCQHITSSIL